jgi:hypothetical protein
MGKNFVKVEDFWGGEKGVKEINRERDKLNEILIR